MARLPRHLGAVLLSALVVLLAACAPRQVQQTVGEAVTPAFEQTQAAAAQVMVPAALTLREAIQGATPALLNPQPPEPRFSTWAGAPAAAALIVRWEVTSPKAYARKYEGVTCPGGASGPTIGIGYDLGHQMRADIARDWAAHPAVDQLVEGSGVVGEGACTAYRAAHRDIRVPYALAAAVFEGATLPAYHAAARRALHAGWLQLPPNAQAANVSMGYNRGWSMSGERNREKRAIRDTCAPAGDAPCNADQLRAMCRLWIGTPNGKGLCARRNDEARVAVSA